MIEVKAFIKFSGFPTRSFLERKNVDPVVYPYGHTYDCGEIEYCFVQRETSPLTKELLAECIKDNYYINNIYNIVSNLSQVSKINITEKQSIIYFTFNPDTNDPLK